MHYLKNTFLPFAFMATLAALLSWTGPAAVAASRGVCVLASRAAMSPGCASRSGVTSLNHRPLNSSLNGMARVSASDIWAVGYYINNNGFQTLIEHWDGTRWSVVPSPNPHNSLENLLTGVAAVSASDIWAVGFYLNSKLDILQALIEHWDGTRWSVVPSPNPPNWSRIYLTGVAAVAATDIWAVGYITNGNYDLDQTLIEHWDGTSWSIVPSPNGAVSHNILNGVLAVSASDIWAVGEASTGALIERWDGKDWSVVPSPNLFNWPRIYLTGVTAVAANDIWAVGYVCNSGICQTLIEHWDGSQWRIVSSTNPINAAYSFLYGVADVSASDIWAVGDYYGTAGSRMSETLIEHWNGTRWSVVPSANGPNSSRDVLTGVTAISANDVWAVGYVGYSGNSMTLIEHWDGMLWRVVTSPMMSDGS